MQKYLRLVALVAVAVLLSPVCGDEESVPLDKVPKPLIAAVKARFPDAKVTGAAKENEEGKLVYEVTIKEKGKTIDVTLTPEGTILLIEREIEAKDMPKAVAQTIDDKYPKAKISLVEEVIKVEKKKETLDFYEVKLTDADKQAWEVQVNPDGKVRKTEKKSGKDE